MKCLPLIREKWKAYSSGRRSAPAGTRSSQDGPTAPASTRSAGSIASSAPGCLAAFDEKASGLRVFEFSELRAATKNFSPTLKIGEGGFGSVYKGYIRVLGGSAPKFAVAIKKLNPNSLQGHKEWLTEVRFLAVVDHPNLVKLIGYCSAETEKGIQRLLVYEYMPNKSLDYHLFNKVSPVLPWHVRLMIILNVARGLKYLHEDLDIPVIFRDFKASNVLLDESMIPKLSDFGLAREGPSDGRSHVSTAVMGTQGYAAPEYIDTGHLSTRSDLWAFGVVLFEMLTGRRALDRNRPKDEQRLLEWIKKFPARSSKFQTVMDPRLENGFDLLTAQRVAELAEACLAKNPKDRPTMGNVVETLQQLVAENSVWQQSPQRLSFPP